MLIFRCDEEDSINTIFVTEKERELRMMLSLCKGDRCKGYLLLPHLNAMKHILLI